MGLRRRFRDFKDWCPQPPSRFPTGLRRYFAPVAILLAITICSVSIFAASSSYLLGASSVRPMPILPLSITSSSVPGFSEVIGQDTTWTAANSPYNLSGNVFVSEGVTLTIEAGVTVNFFQYDMQVNGTLNVEGTAGDKVVFNSTNQYVVDVIQDQTANVNFGDSSLNDVIDGTVFEYMGLGFLNCSSLTLNNDAFPNQSFATFYGGSISIEPEIRGSGTVTITNNIFTGRIEDDCATSTIANNTFTDGGVDTGYGSVLILNNTFTGDGSVNSGVGLNIGYDEKVVVSDNHFSGFSEACIDIAESSAAWIQRNLIENRQTAGQSYPFFGIEIQDASPIIENNTITNCNIGIEVYNYYSYMWSGTAVQANPTIENNNIFNNQEYNLFLGYPERSGYDSSNFYVGNINASYNWWGTTDIQAINRTIWDVKDQSNVGTAAFTPFLTAPNLQASPNPGELTPTEVQIPTIAYMEASGDGRTVYFTVNGNVTLALNSLANVTTTRAPPTTSITFNQEGGGVNNGFLNITIPKNEVPYGKTPTLFADNQKVQDQGYTQDNYNYYVWGTVNNTSYGQLTVEFAMASSFPVVLLLIIGVVTAVAVAIAVELMYMKKKRTALNQQSAAQKATGGI